MALAVTCNLAVWLTFVVFAQVSFNPARDFVDFVSDPAVQRRFMTSAIRLQFDYPAKDAPLLSYYAVASLSIDWRCACFGHASTCTMVNLFSFSLFYHI